MRSWPLVGLLPRQCSVRNLGKSGFIRNCFRPARFRRVVLFYRKTLGGSAIDRPAIDFDAGFPPQLRVPGSDRNSIHSRTR